jgi:GDP-4-dehydro-6-deoxy-D-mannose reductase
VRVLITGASGFLGSWLADALVQDGIHVLGTDIIESHDVPGRPCPDIDYDEIDVTNQAACFGIVEWYKPDVVYHFAGQAYVQRSFNAPVATYQINTIGTLHMLEAIRHYSPKAVFVHAGSGTQYGPNDIACREELNFMPTSPYAASKAAADIICLQHNLAYGTKTRRLRIFGTTGPGKTGDFINDMAQHVVDRETKTAKGPIPVGSLSCRRDIMDVRDAISAFRLIAEKGDGGGAYNVGTGHARSMKDILDMIKIQSNVPITTRLDKAKIRLAEEPLHLADVTWLQNLGWQPYWSLDRTIESVLNTHRANV